MFHRPTFVTNSSSSCMIVWKKHPSDFPDDMKLYRLSQFVCPHCGETIGVKDEQSHCELDDYMDESARQVVLDKVMKGCTIFYNIEYLGHYKEDEFEYGDDEDGWYSFQC